LLLDVPICLGSKKIAIYTNSYQPRGPVPEALRGHGDARQILLLSESNREGKGLSLSVKGKRRAMTGAEEDGEDDWDMVEAPNSPGGA
jgi:hypothetical protein